MARKKSSDILVLVAVAAVAGYFIFRKGIQAPQVAAPMIAPGDQLYAQRQLPTGLAVERPNLTDIGIIVPKVDPTGMQLQFY